MMRRSTIALLVTFVLGIGAGSAAMAQSPSPSPIGVGGRVEVPEAGFAVTLPEGWLWVTTSSGDIERLGGLVVATDPERGPVLSDVLTGWPSEYEVPDLYALASIQPDRPIVESCTVTAYPLSGDSLKERMAGNEAGLSNTPGTTVASTLPVELPVGSAGRLDHVGPFGFPGMGDVAIHGSEYFLADDAREYVLACLAPDPPDDRWLSIAETFESLPGEE